MKNNIIAEDKWEAKLPDWRTIPDETYKLLFELAEKRLKEMIDDGEKITLRSYTLLGLVLTLGSVCLGNMVREKELIPLVLCILGTGSSTYIVIILLQIISPRGIWLLGAEPKDIIEPFLTKEKYSHEEKRKAIFLSEIEQIQMKITKNNQMNLTRIRKYKRCINIGTLTITLGIGLIIGFLI